MPFFAYIHGRPTLLWIEMEEEWIWVDFHENNIKGHKITYISDNRNNYNSVKVFFSLTDRNNGKKNSGWCENIYKVYIYLNVLLSEIHKNPQTLRLVYLPTIITVVTNFPKYG